MSDLAFQPFGLPHWMLVFSVIASFILAILKIVEVVSRALTKASLEIALTREVFFRILDSGESLYASVVLVAYDTGALIQSITSSLTKTNGATKSFGMRVAQIGEKYRAPDGLYQFGFHSTSPVSFVPPNNPQRQVFICEHESYAGDTKQHFQRFQQELLQIREQLGAHPNLDEALGIELNAQVDSAVTKAEVEIMDKVQIEPGNYTLAITVSYRQKGMFFPLTWRRNVTSKVDFLVEDYARNLMRHSLRDHLIGRAMQVLFNQQPVPPAPQYEPAEVREEAK